jgi:hypothetical protein
LTVPTGDLALALGTNVYQHQNCVQAWAEFSIGNLVELVNAVRNRLLDFVLAVWKEAPDAGAPSPQADQEIDPGRVTQIFNTTVYGGAANLVGNASHSSVTFNVQAGDFASLADALRSHGVEDDDVNALQDAMESDDSPTEAGRFGPRVSGWIAGMMQKAAQGSWAVSLGAAGNILARLISGYYGL